MTVLMKNVNGVDLPLTEEEIIQYNIDQAANAANLAANGYKYARVDAYPPVADQLDALWKIIQASPNLVGPDDALAISNQIRQVKLTYPKPTSKGV